MNSGAVIGGDPIESRGIQLQQIARVAKYNPQGIPEDAAKKLAPVFNLDQMAESYFQQDADPVKSSGIQSKKVSYKWRTVTKDDMKDFNDAWWQIVKANPQIALDALFAECFGYFNVTDLPYVSMDYYVNNDYVQSDNEWIHLYNHQWRNQVAGLRQEMGTDSRAWLGDARQPVCHADTADRRRRSGAASMAVAVMASAVAAAYGCDDHRTGQQFRTAYASDRIRVRIPVPGVLARVACRAACPHARRRTLARRWRANGVSRASHRQTAVRQAGRRRTASRWTTA